MASTTNGSSFYCEICKVSCDSDIVFATHLKGQKHLKKLTSPPEGKAASNYCDICNVACTGEKNFECHLAGAKHQKTLNLQNRRSMVNTETNVVEVANDKKEETTGDMPDMPGITVVSLSGGKSVEYKCIYCDCILNSTIALNIHVEGKKHKNKIDPKPQAKKFKNERQPFGSSMLIEDRYVIHKHTEIEPTHQQVALVMKFIQSVETALRRANAIIAGELEVIEKEKTQPETMKSDNNEADSMEESNMNENETGDTTEKINQRNARRVSRAPITLVRRVGNFFKGLLQKDNLDTEVVVICKARPTKSLMRNICEKIDSLLKEMKRDCVLQLSSNAIVISQAISLPADAKQIVPEDGAENATASFQFLRCKIYFTSKNLSMDSNENIDESNEAAEPISQIETDDELDLASCQLAAKMCKCARWFEFNSSYRPFLVMQRIMKDIKRRNPVFQSLTDWSLELFVHKSLSVESSLSSLTPSQALRRVFESIIEGIGDELEDPCEGTNGPKAVAPPTNSELNSAQPVCKVNVLNNLSDEDKENLKNAAQANLKLMDSGEIYKILGYEKPLEESEFKSFTSKPPRFNQLRRKRPMPNRFTNDPSAAKMALVEKNNDFANENQAKNS